MFVLNERPLPKYEIASRTEVFPDPFANFTVPDSACVGAEITIENNSTFQCNDTIGGALFPSFNVNEPNFYYDFGDCTAYGSQPNSTSYNQEDYNDTVHYYNAPGIYYVLLSADNFCNSSYFYDTVTIFPPPKVSFYAESECLNDTTVFITDVSVFDSSSRTLNCGITIPVPAGGTPISYQWSMIENVDGSYVNGTTKDSLNAQFVFNSCGLKTVSLTVFDENNCDSTYTNTIIIHELPIPIFSVNSVCDANCSPIGEESTFDSLCYGAPIINWEYIITDNATNTNIDTLIFTSDSTNTDSCYLFEPNCNGTILPFFYNYFPKKHI